MERVLRECAAVEKGFAADPVHDLRVALRRCRSIADGIMAVDACDSWKRMKKAGRALFRSLGNLRDAHVMRDWVSKLSSPDDPTGQTLCVHIGKLEDEAMRDAARALTTFDRKQWQAWARELPERSGRIPSDSVVFRHMALERWNEARHLQRQALRNRSQASLHQLRIGLKRFRYTVENFLPELDAKWSGDLKQLQDLLGDVHDVDVLWATASKIKAFPDIGSRDRWRARISQERAQRIVEYRSKMVGRTSLWSAWRGQLPTPSELPAAGLERLKAWASFLDPDFAHSKRVAELALQFYDGFASGGNLPGHGQNFRNILQAAALLHDVGRARKEKGHHKLSTRMIRRLPAPLGWTEQDLRMAAVVARYHRGSLPQSGHKLFRSLPAEQQAWASKLAGILRLVNAFDSERDGRIRQLRVRLGREGLVVQAQGYSPYARNAQEIASARFLLERSIHMPVILKPWRGLAVHPPRAAP